MIFKPNFSNQEMNLKSVAILQYKPEGPHMLFYMTTCTTKANIVWEHEHTHARQA